MGSTHRERDPGLHQYDELPAGVPHEGHALLGLRRGLRVGAELRFM